MMMRTSQSRIRSALVALTAALSVGAGASAQAAEFTYAGFTFEQDHTPDVLSLLGDGDTLGGAAFSAGFAEDITRSVGFIATSGSANAGFVGAAGFDPALSLGRQGNAQHGLTQGDGTSSVFSSAINLPNGNDGSSTRHGLGFSWSGGFTLANGAGDDFVVYESGSNSASPEAFMVRVRNADTGAFSGWFYQPFDAFELYVDDSDDSTGVFAHAFDLSDLGLGDGDAIDLIQLANLTSADTLGAGNAVLFDGSGSAHGFGSGSLDPDPLYVGILARESVTPGVPAPAALPAGLALMGLALMRRRR